MAEDMRGSSELLPWTVAEETLVQASGLHPAAAAAPPPPPALSVAERISSPAIFMHQTFVFERALDAAKLRSALADSLTLFPTLVCRATKDLAGEWVLCQPNAGALLSLGTSAAPLHLLAPLPPQPVAPLANLGSQLFAHLADLPADGTAAATVPLLQLALVTLQGGTGGCVLGIRLSHMIGDFATLRALLFQLARQYSGRQLAPCDVPAPAAPLLEALGKVPPPPGSQPWNYVPLPTNIGEQIQALLTAPPLQGVLLHVPPARLAAIKAQAATEAAAEAAAGGGEGIAGGGNNGSGIADGGSSSSNSSSGRQPAVWISTNNALMAWLWRTLAMLPCHRGEVTPFFQALGMRGRLPAAAYAGSGSMGASSTQPPRWVYGNLAACSLTQEMDVARMSLGAVALALRRSIISDVPKFAADIALVAQGEASCARPCSSLTLLPIPHIGEAVAAGRRPFMMVSQLSLDYAADADFDGQLPVGAECTFGRVILPVAHVQPAPPAAGDGLNIYLWLRPDETRELAAAVAAEQWC